MAMKSNKSTFTEVVTVIEGLALALDPQRIGPDLLTQLAGRLAHRAAVMQTGPDGAEWEPLRPATLRTKAREGYPPSKGYETGLMWDEYQFRGRQLVTPTSARMTYGMSPRARERLEFFTEGTKGPGPSRIQIPRPGAYELDSEDEAYIDEFHEQAIDEWMDGVL